MEDYLQMDFGAPMCWFVCLYVFVCRRAKTQPCTKSVSRRASS